MKAIAVTPGQANSAQLRDVPEPTRDQIPGGRGVLVQVPRVGLDGTDEEINAGQYGAAPEGFDYLVPGHESLGVVLQAGPKVTELAIAETEHPGWLERLLTHPIRGLEEWPKAFDLLGAPGVIKVFAEVAR